MANSIPKTRKFQDLLEEKKLKYTYERRRIYEESLRLKGHFDADSLYERLKNQGERVSRDTVYRTLPLLLESGAIQKSMGEGHKTVSLETPGGKRGNRVLAGKYSEQRRY